MTLKDQAELYFQSHTELMGSDWDSNLHISAPLAGYIEADVEWTLKLLGKMQQVKKLMTQRPLIHNGRKMKK